MNEECTARRVNKAIQEKNLDEHNNNNNNLDWGPVPRFAPWKHCTQCGLLYDSPFSKRSYFGHQVPLASPSSQRRNYGREMVAKWCLAPPGFFPSEGRRAEDFYRPLKIQRPRPGLNPRTWVSEASTLPLHHRSRIHEHRPSEKSYPSYSMLRIQENA